VNVGRSHQSKSADPVDEAIEMIDVGGTALLSSAARNHAGVAAVPSPSAYGQVVAEIRARGSVSAELRQRLAAEAFAVVAAYHAEVAAYLNQVTGTTFPPHISVVLEKVADLAHGENPHQRAAFYRETTHRDGTMADATRLQGREPSFNDLLDLDAAWRVAADFAAPTAVVVRHTDPVGIASDDDLAGAFRRALETDPAASFGSIVGVNRPVDDATAREVAEGTFEAVVAPGYTEEALRILSARPELEVFTVPPNPSDGLRDYGIAALDFKRVDGGLLVETADSTTLDRGQLRSDPASPGRELVDPMFARRRRHVRLTRSSSSATSRRSGSAAAASCRSQWRSPCAARDRPDGRAVVRRPFPVPRRHRLRGGRRRHRDHPAGRLPPRRDGNGGRRPAPPRDGLHRPAPLPALSRAASHHAGGFGPMERLLALEADSVTEPRMPGAPHGPRHTMDADGSRWRPCAGLTILIDARIVIGEGERDEAPELYIGERRRPAAPWRGTEIDIAVDPLRG
jgi:hypothetical protein